MDTVPSARSLSLPAAALADLIGTPRAPCVLDARGERAFAASAFTIPGALRADPVSLATWAASAPPQRRTIVCCAHGREVSREIARELSARGIDAGYLENGIDGWRAAGLPMLRIRADVGIPASLAAPTRWVTRERPKIDRIACPWLITRFIDPDARFFYVPADQVASEAASLDAVPYDVPSVTFSHRGDACSFDAFLDEFGLHVPALNAMAIIVRAADTGHPERSPQAPGLLAVSLGLSAMFDDDLEMLRDGLRVYDALYAWIRHAHAERPRAKPFGQS